MSEKMAPETTPLTVRLRNFSTTGVLPEGSPDDHEPADPEGPPARWRSYFLLPTS
jgi:hypothetical protein